MARFVPNEEGLAALEKQIQSRMSAIEVDRSMSEDEAVEDVMRQLRAMGVTPDPSGIRQMVREQLG